VRRRRGKLWVLIVSNNAAWNIERYDQQANYGGRVMGTTLRHSDYAAMAPALVDVVTSQEGVSSDARKVLDFVPDYRPLTAWDEAEHKRRVLPRAEAWRLHRARATQSGRGGSAPAMVCVEAQAVLRPAA
jgi:hypothetical protein